MAQMCVGQPCTPTDVVWKGGLVRNLPDRDQQRGVCQPVSHATHDGSQLRLSEASSREMLQVLRTVVGTKRHCGSGRSAWQELVVLRTKIRERRNRVGTTEVNPKPSSGMSALLRCSVSAVRSASSRLIEPERLRIDLRVCTYWTAGRTLMCSPCADDASHSGELWPRCID